MRHHDARELANDLRRFAAADPTARTAVVPGQRAAGDTRGTGGGTGGGGRVAATRPQDVPDTGPGAGERNPWSAIRVLGITLVVLAVLALAGAATLLALR
jgi:hypothetical protein